MFPSGAGLIFTDLPPSGRYGECGRALRFARAVSSRCGVDRGVRFCRTPIATFRSIYCMRAGMHDPAARLEPRRVSGKPVTVSAAKGVAVGGGGQDDVHAAVVRMVEPAQGYIGDEDVADLVVSDVA